MGIEKEVLSINGIISYSRLREEKSNSMEVAQMILLSHPEQNRINLHYV